MADYRFKQEVVFNGHVYGSNNAYSTGGQFQAIRGNDGFYWDGSDYVSTETWVDTTPDTDGLAHYYDWSTGSAVDGDTFVIKLRIKDDPDTESVGTIELRSNGSGGVIVVRPLFIFDD